MIKKTYFTLVLALSDEERQKHEEYKKVNAVHLYNHAKMLMEQVENGEVPDDKMLEAIKLGAAEFVTKPFETGQIISILEGIK